MVSVSIVRCERYGRDGILAALERLLAPLGGMEHFVRPGMKVLLKPNLLGPFSPESAVLTHPDVVAAAAILVKRAGGVVLVGDSPGCGSVKQVLKTSGIGAVLEELQLEWTDLETPAEFEFPDNRVAKRICLGAGLKQPDIIINLPKAKTHVQMVYTGAMKNLYGLLPGTSKSEYHYRMRTREWFSELLLDINQSRKPALNIIDAVEAMEGEGPSGGTPRKLNFLAASADAVALDTAVCSIIHLPPEKVPLLNAARKRNFGCSDLSRLEVLGGSLAEFDTPDFRHVRSLKDPLQLLPLPRKMLEYLQQHWKAVPVIDREKCVQCLRCANGCPVKPAAIDPKQSSHADSTRCIRCYCCHEFCPVKAIRIPSTLLERTLMHPRVRALAAWLAGNRHRKSSR